MSLFDIFRDLSHVDELRRLADAKAYANFRSKLEASRQHQERQSANQRIEELEEEVATLTILVEAMLEKFYELKLLNEAGLAQKIAEIDMRDGVADGKITKKKSPATLSKQPKKEVKIVTRKPSKPAVKLLYPEPKRKPFSKESNKKKY